MKYNVCLYRTGRINILNIEAGSQIEAVEIAENKYHGQMLEDAGQPVAALVDEADDNEHKRTHEYIFTAKGIKLDRGQFRINDIYYLNMDPERFKEQRKCLLDLIQELKTTNSAETVRDLGDIQRILDTIADQAADHHGLDVLLEDKEPR